MYGNTKLTALLGAGLKDTTAASYVAYGRALAGAGLPVLLIKPGSKAPLDMRTEAERTKDDKDARGANTGGVHLATTDRARIKKYVERALKDKDAKRPKGHPAPVTGPLNFAIRLAGSGYVVADADTPAEVEALRTWLAPAYGGDVDRVPGPTVLTPGSSDQAHAGGGHWYFKLPESLELDTASLPASTRVQVGDSSFSLMAGNAYVLIPPSVRAEGAYHVVTSDSPAPDCLISELTTAGAQFAAVKAERQAYKARAAAGELTDLEAQIARWSEGTSWEDILTPAGWTLTGMVDSCGCPIWTAPGAHSSPKSATTHISTCTQDRVDVLNPPIHIWTDNPGPELEAWIKDRGSKTLSKLSAFAALHHGGDMSSALSTAGIESDPTGQVFDPTPAMGITSDSFDAVAPVADKGDRAVDGLDDMPYIPPETGQWREPRRYTDTEVEVLGPSGGNIWDLWKVEDVPSLEDMTNPANGFAPIGLLSDYDDMPPTEYVVDGFLEHKGLCSVIGASGIGKSGVVLDMAACIATGQRWHGRKVIQTPVLYVAGEGVSGAVDRLKAWQRATGTTIEDGQLLITGEAVLFGAHKKHWAALCRQARAYGVGLIIFDTLARMSYGLDENSATDMSKAVTIFDRIRRSTGAGVLYVHHTARGTNHGRGSTALLGAADSEILVTDTLVDGKPFNDTEDGAPADAEGNPLPGAPLCVQVTKQKNSQDGDYMYLCRTSSSGSLVITDLDGNAGTPAFARGGGAEPGQARPESVAVLAERITEYVARYKSGVKFPTVTDIKGGVTVSNFYSDKPASAWKDAINLAVDYALQRGDIFKRGAGYSIEPDLDY